MSAEVLQFRPFQSAVDQARKLGTNATMAIVRRVRDEQRKGLSGNSVARDLQQRRLSGDDGTNPPPDEAA